jgi:RnfABCDGE-type electron transport complex B subunit
MDATIIIAIITMGGLGFIFASGLAFADRKLRVDENPLIGKINEALPNANCGGCGYAGCYDFAVKLVEGNAKPNGCPVGGEETTQNVAELLGIDSESIVKMKPVVLCRGGKTEAFNKNAKYIGPSNCKTEIIISGGDKLCFYGCLGGGDCVSACQFNAIFINENGLPEIINEFCKGCGMCVKACPRNIIEMHPLNRNIFIFCKNEDEPKRSKEVCSVSCIGCGICARKSDGGIEMINNLAIINYDSTDLSKIPIEKCSTGAIKTLSLKNIMVN